MRPQLVEHIRVDSDGRMPLLPWHMERLTHSCHALAYHWSADLVARAIARAAADLPEGATHKMRVRVSDDGEVDIDCAVLEPIAALPLVKLANGQLASHEPLLRHKTTWRPWYDDATRWLAGHPAYADLLFLNERGELCEGSRANVYVLLDGRWITPPPACGLLPGVQRAALLDDEEVEEGVVRLEDLGRAEGIRLSSALRGWFDVEFRAARF